jgi:hypothetical protein
MQTNGRTDGQTHMIEPIVALCSFANASKTDGETVNDKTDVID